MIGAASATPCVATGAVVTDRTARPYIPSRAWGANAVRDSADSRNRWRAALVRVAQLCDVVITRDGERSPVLPDVRHAVATAGAEGFPVEGAVAQAVAQAFRIQFTALLDATIPR